MEDGSVNFNRELLRASVCLWAASWNMTNESLGAAFHQVLTSVESNTRVEEWRIDHESLPGISDGAWSVEKVVLRGGKQEGVDLIVVDSGAMRIRLIPTRGMSVLDLQVGDWRIGWESPVKEVVHPRHIRLGSRGGLGWLEGFNEWMVRCGLESAGHPGEDRFVDNTGAESTLDLTLHGKIGNIPASEVEVIIEKEPVPRIRIRGRVDERSFYGPQLELWTEVAVDIGSTALQFHDELTNHGAEPQEFQLIYHINFGEPLLEANAEFVAAARRVAPFNARAAESIDRYEVYEAPTPGFAEQVYCVFPRSSEDGKAMAALVDAKKARGVSVTWRLDQLPYLTQWKNTPGRAAGYVTGIEPGTGFPYNRRLERIAGRVPKLEPGATRSFDLEVDVLNSPSRVADTIDRVESIRGGRSTRIDTEPLIAPEP